MRKKTMMWLLIYEKKVHGFITDCFEKPPVDLKSCEREQEIRSWSLEAQANTEHVLMWALGIGIRPAAVYIFIKTLKSGLQITGLNNL